MKPIAQRMQHFTPHFFAALGPRLAELQAAGKDVIRLDEGSPDLPPSPDIIAALSRSAADTSPYHHSYQPHRGPQGLRQAWARMYQRVFAVDLDPEREVVPLLGSKEGIFHLMMALVDPGDVVLIPDPGYITYTRGTLFAGGEPYYLPLLPERGYLPDLQSIPPEITQRAKLLWLNYPNNPTGATISREFLAEAVAFAAQYNLLICHDAAYTQVTFDGYQAPSLLAVPGGREVGIEFNTLSKSHNMAGWRVGAALGCAQALRSLYTLKTNLDSSHFLPILEAACSAMDGDQGWLVERNAIYARRRDRLVSGLRQLGLAASTPRAGLYVWCPTPAGWSCEQFVTSVLENACVSLTPGSLFGKGGQGYVRISFTAPEERIAQALVRLADWMATWA